MSDEGDVLRQQVPESANDLALTVVIPAFNEAERLPNSLRRLLEVVREGTIDDLTTEFVVVDDGSTDQTAEIARALLQPLSHSRVLRSPSNRGKGSAIRTGIESAVGRHIIFTDADMAMDPSQIPAIAKALGEADVAIASRAKPGRGIDYGSQVRNAMGRLFNRLVNLMTGIALEDTQCGLKGFHASVARLLFHSKGIERFAFDVEILALARKLGLTIAEVPVNWDNVAGSRVRPLADPISMLADVVRLRFGRLPANPIPLLAPAGGTSVDDACRQVAGWRYPLLHRDADPNEAILVPLAGEETIDDLRRRLIAQLHGAPVVKGFTTYTQLIEQAPYSLEV